MTARPNELELVRKDDLCTIGFQYSNSTGVSLFSVNERIVVFDTHLQAKWFIEWLAASQDKRITWDKKAEEAMMLPYIIGSINKAMVITQYDPYNLPPNCHLRAKSEAKHRDWKYHVHFAEIHGIIRDDPYSHTGTLDYAASRFGIPISG